MIRGYTNIEQSRKLAEILPLESADVFYKAGNETQPTFRLHSYGHIMSDKDVTAWSLAALLGVLPNKIVSHETAFEEEDAEGINDIYYKCIESTEDGRYMCYYSGNGYKYKYVADNPVDACVELILKLHKLNLL